MAPPGRMVTLSSDIFKCCHTVRTLGLENDAGAKKLLTRAADQVRPIMAKRGWSVPVAEEFYPPGPKLLGLNHNHGEKIQVRLRRPSNVASFLPYESILGTLLHELVHNDIGPHDARFYKVLDEIKAECMELMARGNDGKGGAGGPQWGADGKRLGDWAAHNVPRHRARDVAADAASKRLRVQSVMGRAGGVRLGGSADIARLCDPREMALAAAERRRADEVWCASAAEQSTVPEEGAKSARGGADEVIVIESSDDEAVIVIDDDGGAPEPVPKRAERPAVRVRGAPEIPIRQSAAAQAALRRSQGW